MSGVFLTAIGTVAGQLLPLEDYAADDGRRASLRFLRDDSFSHFVKLDGAVEQIVASAVRDTISKSHIVVTEVDAIIVSSETIWAEPMFEGQSSTPAFFHHRDQVLTNLVNKLGCAQAFLYGVCMSACANFASSLNLAASLVLSRNHNRVIVTLVDRLHSFDSRIATNGMSLFSDVAVAFLVTSQLGDYQVEHTTVHFSGDVLSAAIERNNMLRGRHLAAALQKLDEKVILKAGKRINAYDRVVTDTSHSLQLELISEVLQLDPQKIITFDKSRGHAFSADCPLSLKWLKETGACAIGDKVGALNIGPWAFGFTSLGVTR